MGIMAKATGKSPNYNENAALRKDTRRMDAINDPSQGGMSEAAASLLFAPITVVSSVNLLADVVGDNATDISNNATSIGNNATAISANTSDISDNTGDISDNATAISANASNITDNEDDISDIQAELVKFVGTDGVTDGAQGFVPKPSMADEYKFLSNEGWSSLKLKQHPVITSSVILTEPGSYTVDCAGGTREVRLPYANGSGEQYVISFINVSRVRSGKIQFASGDKINGVDTRITTFGNTTYHFMDRALDHYVSAGVISASALIINVPSDFSTIEEAIGATAHWRCTTGIIYIRLTNGQHVWDFVPRCDHPNNVIIRGTTAQYFPKPSDDNTVFTGDKAVDMATAEALGGTILKVDIIGSASVKSKGINLSYAPSLTFAYLQIHDNRNGTPFVTPATYAIYGLYANQGVRYDRVLVMGSAYGIYLAWGRYFRLAYMCFVNCYARSFLASYCGQGSVASCSSWNSRYHSMFYHCGGVYITRPEAKHKNYIGESSSTYGIYVRYNTSCNIVYPKLHVKSTAIVSDTQSTVLLSVHPTVTTELNCSLAVSVNNAAYFSTNGNGSSSMDIQVSSSRVVQVSGNSVIVLTAAFSTAANPNLVVGKTLEVRRGSIGYNAALAAGNVASPAVGVDGNVLSHWIS